MSQGPNYRPLVFVIAYILGMRRWQTERTVSSLEDVNDWEFSQELRFAVKDQLSHVGITFGTPLNHRSFIR